MSLRDWFAARQQGALVDSERKQREVAEGLWTKCDDCHAPLFSKELSMNLGVCPKCDHHFRISARERIKQILDPGSFKETHAELRSLDPLEFVDSRPYPQRLAETYAKVGTGDAVIVGSGTLKGQGVAIAVMDFAFMGGSMGSVVGEKITRTIEDSMSARTPLLIVTSSGGARMQEGTLSLMQMAKTSAALARFAKEGLLYISVLADPTTGGVSASFGSLADVILAEPGAIIGFAGRRVIEATIRQKAPADFQTAEWVLKHGQIDQIVPRPRLRETLAQLVMMHTVRKLESPAVRASLS